MQLARRVSNTTKNTIMVELNVYKNTNTTSAQYGKAYARVDYKEQFDVAKLAKHMSEENLAIFKASVTANPCSRYGVMRATIGSKSVKVGGQTVETGNAVKSMRLVAQATGQYTTAELNKDATLGWTKKAQEAINADKAAMQQAQGGNG